MSNIRVDLPTLTDGMEVTFQAPTDCSKVTGLIVYYYEDDSQIYKIFSFVDANCNDLANIDNLFAKDAYIKVILDTVNSRAYIQNADTNAYLENHIGTHNIKTYTSFEQIGLVVGEETIESIVNALPEGSMLTVAISTNNNTEIYPKDSGLLRVTKNTPDIKFEFNWFTSGAAPTMWEGVYYTETSEWYGWSRHYGLGISEEEVLNILLKYGSLPIDKGGTGATTAEEALSNLGTLPKRLLLKSVGDNYNYAGNITDGSFVTRITGSGHAPTEILAKYPSEYGTHVGIASGIDGAYMLHLYYSQEKLYFLNTQDGEDISLDRWIELADASKFLPLDGSVPMSGNFMSNGEYIKINSTSSYPKIIIANKNIGRSMRFELQGNGSGLFCMDDGTNDNRSFISLQNETANLEDILKIFTVINKKASNYKIYGEHNITKGTTNLTAGTSTLASGCIYLQYE